MGDVLSQSEIDNLLAALTAGDFDMEQKKRSLLRIITLSVPQNSQRNI